MLKMIVRVGLVIAVVVAVVAVFRSYHGKNCRIVGTGIAGADEDCPHQDSISTRWAEAQQQQLTMSWAPVTTGLLFTEANGENPTVLPSGESGEEFDLALQYLKTYPTSAVGGQPQGQQAAGHVEMKAAALMRQHGDTYGVLVINNPIGPCTYGGTVTEARIGGDGVSAPYLTARTEADRVAMIDRYLVEYPNDPMFLELKQDDSRSWREHMRDLDHREYMQVGIVGNYAAAQYCRFRLKCADPIVHATINPHPLPNAPRIPYDPELSWYFPAENVISRAEVRQLMIDFVLTGDWSHTGLWRDQEDLVAAGR